MRYEDLDILVTLADCKSINKTAQKFLVSSVAIGKKIDSLEKEFKTSLFNRTPLGCELTDSGKIVIDYAKKINLLLDECKQKVNKAIKIRVGFSFLYDREYYYQLQSAIKLIDKKCELIPVSLDSVFHGNSIKKILSYIKTDIDLILDIEGNMLNDEYVVLPFGLIKQCLLVPKKHKLYDKKTIEIEDICDLKLLKLADGFYKTADNTVDLIKRKCKNVVFEELKDSFADIGKFCEDNNVVFLCLDSFKNIEPDERIIPLGFVEPVAFSLFYRKDSPKEILDIINEIYEAIKLE